ncbi:TetR/AcrR family transcriptional regulator [Nitratifractor sp.]
MKQRMKEKILQTKRELILEEVSPIFEAEGPSSVKMADLAERLGISVGALYKLFPSKEALFYAYTEYQIRRFHETLLRECKGLPHPEACLERFAALKIETLHAKRHALEDPILGDPLFFFKMNIRRQNPATPIAEYLADQFRRLDRERPLREKDFLRLAYLYNGQITGAIEFRFLYDRPSGDPDREAKELLSLFLQGVVQ